MIAGIIGGNNESCSQELVGAPGFIVVQRKDNDKSNLWSFDDVPARRDFAQDDTSF